VVICAKTAEQIKMPFGLWAQMGPRNRALHGGPDPPWEGAILGEGASTAKYRDTLQSPVRK